MRPRPGPYYSFNDVAETTKELRQVRRGSDGVRQLPRQAGLIESMEWLTQTSIRQSKARDAVLSVSQRAQELYPVVVLLATLAALWMLINHHSSPLAVNWMCWLALVLAASAVGMAVDRYIWAMEPLLLMLVGAAIDKALEVSRLVGPGIARRLAGRL